MENKKDIGKLFKDNLSQLDYSPSEMVWDKIETDLKKEKKNRRFFFWIFFSSLIIIGITSYSYYHFNSVNEKTNNGTISTALNSNTNQNNNTVSNSSEENININSNTNQNNNIVLNNSKETVISNNSRNNSTNSYNISNNFNSIEKSNSKFNSKNSINNSYETNATKKSLVSNSRTKSSKKSSYETNAAMKKSLISNTNQTKETSAYKSNRNSKSKKANSVNSTENNFYSNTTNKATKQLTTQKKKSNNSTKTDGANLSKNNSLAYNSSTGLNEENLVNSEGINFTEIDSCCADENCIVTSERNQKKTEKKKLPKTKEDSIVKPKSKTFIVSPFSGFNSNYKIGEENKFGNSEVIDSPKKYGNLFGLKLKWMFSEKTGIQTGVSINTYYYNTTVKKSSGGLDTESIELNQQPSTLNTLFSNSEKVTFQQYLRYVEIPIEAYHYFNTSKLNHAASAGISFYLPIKNEVHAYSENVSKTNIGKSVAYLKQGYGLNLNYYLNYNLSNKFQIFISPAAQFQFLGNIDYNQSTSYSFSISTGINYKL